MGIQEFPDNKLSSQDARKKHFKEWTDAKIVSWGGFSLVLALGLSLVSCPQNINVGANGYSVTYNGNGNSSGSAPTDGTAYQQGDTATVLGNTGSLVKTGYSFNGWNTIADASGTAYAIGAKIEIESANVILYANWVVIPLSEVSGLSADYGNTRAKLSWTEPSDSAFTGVEIRASGFTTVAVSKGTKSQAILGLTNNTTYTFKVVSVYSDNSKSSGVTIAVTPNGSAGVNLIENGNFADGLRSWNKNLGKDWGSGLTGNATVSVASGVLDINVVSVDSGNPTDIQVNQTSPGFLLSNGFTYKVTLTARADSSDTIGVSVWENGHDTNNNG